MFKFYCNPSQAWWYLTAISTTLETELDGSISKVTQGKIVRPYLKNKIKKKELGMWVEF
jgi:hypothetical protein